MYDSLESILIIRFYKNKNKNFIFEFKINYFIKFVI